MRFVPTTPTNASGSGGAWWLISVASPLPAITQADTTVNGTAYSSADGDVTIVDPNPGQVGTGGTVGVDGLTLDKVTRPVLELTGGNAFTGEGLEIDAGYVTLSGLAVNGFGTDGGRHLRRRPDPRRSRRHLRGRPGRDHRPRRHPCRRHQRRHHGIPWASGPTAPPPSATTTSPISPATA